jgi:hypothetical protein
MSPRTGPCSWPLVYCGDTGGGSSVPGSEPTERGCSHLASLDPAVAEIIEDAAVAYLWNWTGKQFGTCEITLRPCRQSCFDDWTTYRGTRWQGVQLPWYGGWGGAGPVNPALIGGQWYNLPCGSCGDECSCGPVRQIDLPGPVSSVTEVVIDAVALPTSSYRVDNHRWLVRLDGEDWPLCQNMNADPATDLDTFAVTYLIGTSVPAGGQIAAGKLACEMAKAQCGGSGCQLPQRLQTITRQGVTMGILDSMESLYAEGSTGIWMVDSWVASINGPARKRGPGRVASPDVRAPRRTTS